MYIITMDLKKIEEVYTGISQEIEKLSAELKTMQDQAKIKKIDSKLNTLLSCRKSIGKLMMVYRFEDK